ncbi:MAG: ankyrin repeat domain-containing protein [Acidobacteriota bacterium]
MSALNILGQAPADEPADDFLGQPREISSHEFLTALVEGRKEDIAKMIVQDDRLVKSRDAAGASAVQLAVYHSLDEVLGVLLRSEVPLDLGEAAAVGDVDRVRELHEEARGAGEAAPEGFLDEPSGDGFPPLVLAATYGRLEVAKLLLESGADPGSVAQNPTLSTPLHGAACCADAGAAQAITQLLLGAGADPNAEQAGGFTPLHQAAVKGHGPVLKLLLGAGADPKAESDMGLTAGRLAADRGHVAAMALLP